MISVSTHVQSWLEEHPFTRNSLAEGVINHSALARKIKADIEKQLGEKISNESVTIALNRAGKNVAKAQQSDPLSFIGDVSIQTGLTILVYNIADFDKLQLSHIANNKQGYFVSTRGIWYASIITTADVARSPVLSDKAIEQQTNMSALTIKLREGHIPIPGVCASILSFLANKGVNLQEVVSTHNELTILTDQANTDRALQCLMRIKQSTTSKVESV